MKRRWPAVRKFISPEAIVARAAILKAQGFEVLPPCDNCDAQGYCTGHAASEEQHQ